MMTKIICSARLKLRALLTSAVIAASAASFNQAAMAKDFGIGGNVGTTGVSIEGQAKVLDNLAVRASYSYLYFKDDKDQFHIKYSRGFNFKSGGLFLDAFPFDNSFAVSGGVYYGEKQIDLKGKPYITITIGGDTYTFEEFGTLTGNLSGNEAAPYLGIGYDNFMKSDSPFSFNLRAGAIYIGNPKATLESVDGLLSHSQLVVHSIEREVKKLEGKFKKYKFYPIASVGFTAKF